MMLLSCFSNSTPMMKPVSEGFCTTTHGNHTLLRLSHSLSIQICNKQNIHKCKEKIRKNKFTETQMHKKSSTLTNMYKIYYQIKKILKCLFIQPYIHKTITQIQANIVRTVNTNQCYQNLKVLGRGTSKYLSRAKPHVYKCCRQV